MVHFWVIVPALVRGVCRVWRTCVRTLSVFLRFLLLLLCLQIAFASTAHAYLDPGTGSFIFQAIIAGLVGASVTLKMYWGQVKAFLSRKRGAAPEAPEKDAGESS